LEMATLEVKIINKRLEKQSCLDFLRVD
jgi:hypothetical protein